MISSIQNYQNSPRLSATNKQTKVTNSPSFGSTLLIEYSHHAKIFMKDLKTSELPVARQLHSVIKQSLAKLIEEFRTDTHPSLRAFIKIKQIKLVESSLHIFGKLNAPLNRGDLIAYTPLIQRIEVEGGKFKEVDFSFVHKVFEEMLDAK